MIRNLIKSNEFKLSILTGICIAGNIYQYLDNKELTEEIKDLNSLKYELNKMKLYKEFVLELKLNNEFKKYMMNYLEKQNLIYHLNLKITTNLIKMEYFL